MGVFLRVVIFVLAFFVGWLTRDNLRDWPPTDTACKIETVSTLETRPVLPVPSFMDPRAKCIGRADVLGVDVWQIESPESYPWSSKGTWYYFKLPCEIDYLEVTEGIEECKGYGGMAGGGYLYGVKELSDVHMIIKRSMELRGIAVPRDPLTCKHEWVKWNDPAVPSGMSYPIFLHSDKWDLYVCKHCLSIQRGPDKKPKSESIFQMAYDGIKNGGPRK